MDNHSGLENFNFGNFKLLFPTIAHLVMWNIFDGNSSELCVTPPGYRQAWHSGLACSYFSGTDPLRIYLHNRELTDYPIFLLWDK